LKKENSSFLRSKVWVNFRKKVYDLFKGKDPLTQSKLYKGYSTHHLDQRKANYYNLDEERFLPLNKKSHECVHFLYRYYIKDKKIIDRLIEILDKMEKYSNDRVENKEAEGTK
jgi:hypothetical protein